MTSDHRGRPVAGNHRPTPRLAQLFTRLKEMPDENGVSGYLHPERVQNAINEYRDMRDAGVADASALILPSHLTDAVNRETLQNALSKRHNI